MMNIQRLAVAVGITLLCAFGPSLAAFAQDAATNPRNVCLRIRDVDHTHAVGNKVLLFTMRNGEVWRNQLKGPCSGLEFYGYSETLYNERVCANQQTIYVFHTGAACILGDFTLDKPAPKGD